MRRQLLKLIFCRWGNLTGYKCLKNCWSDWWLTNNVTIPRHSEMRERACRYWNFSSSKSENKTHHPNAPWLTFKQMLNVLLRAKPLLLTTRYFILEDNGGLLRNFLFLLLNHIVLGLGPHEPPQNDAHRYGYMYRKDYKLIYHLFIMQKKPVQSPETSNKTRRKAPHIIWWGIKLWEVSWSRVKTKLKALCSTIFYSISNRQFLCPMSSLSLA